MCVWCRERSTKRSLTRIVRTPEGRVEIDLTGKRNGRGAYLCDDPVCWERALSSDRLGHALKTTIEERDIETLRRHAAALPAPDGAATTSQEGSTQ
jgi:predicted RNA-binding protein YlxR (DUF448 family)